MQMIKKTSSRNPQKMIKSEAILNGNRDIKASLDTLHHGSSGTESSSGSSGLPEVDYEEVVTKLQKAQRSYMWAEVGVVKD
jgi:hypothetical protein